MSKISDYLGKSATENVKHSLDLARQNDEYHALLRLTENRALERAAKVDAGEIGGRLAGVPFVVKDNFMAFDGPTTASSHMLENFISPVQAVAVEKLEAEGAVCIGKANLDAFAHGGSTENSAFGVTLNSHDKSRVSGGSSGGSAVVTALGIVPFALGSDTGGSIRQPASFNGVFGFKPTYGSISRYGVVAMASSTDVIGTFTTTSEDAEIQMEILSGKDDSDMTTLDDFYQTEVNEPKNLRIGVVKEFMGEGIDESVRASTNNYIEKLKSAGHTIEDVSLPIVKHTLAMYYIIVPAEVSSNLARYDGIRYGHRSNAAKNLAEVYGMSRDEGFEAENKRRIMIGSYVLSSGYFDAYYNQAQKGRTLLIEQFDDAFKNVDVLIGPVAPTPAFKIGENTSDPIKMYTADILTVPASLAGLPALSVPSTESSEGLPIGVQLIGKRKSDSLILALAKSMENK
jgi:aspartyl-tRNA(Asn)/glutamyl-tRNA(Gln) amidotransferase subunit A